jgi:hypothetical protein
MAPRKAAAPITMNAAPGFQQPGLTAPGGPYGPPPGAAQQQAPTNGAGGFGAPPQQGERNPFIKAAWLWQKFGQQGGGRAKIVGYKTNNPRTLTNGSVTSPGWNLDVIFEDGTKMTATVNQGDIKHQRLFAKFGNNIIGQTVIIRLSHPGDLTSDGRPTKAPWVIEC